ncbi:centrobin isoform X3 [Choloepus didactylus]|uniref:centrobin isoform X3 n=1 Tax=Choloepus didactylus TaxID=27675 RepID=UPI00189F3E4F|nr:centrobin isoform X3 [Choloepus didactylus]
METSIPSPSSPLRSEDLLSDSSDPPGLNQVSSEVTSQLYTSLRLSRQAEATARAQLYLPSSTPPPHEVLEGLAQELSRSLSVGLENNLKKKDGSKHIFEMESVRGQLQSILQTSRDTTYRDLLAPGASSERREDDSFDSESTATLLNTRPLQDLSPSSSAQALEELFPRYTSLRPGPSLNPPDFQGLRDALDSEHTRRKTVTRLEQSLSEAIQALNLEQEGTRQQQRERETLEEERQALTLSLELEQQRCQTLEEERDEARAGRLSEHRQLEALQAALEEERQTWAQQEHQLKERCQALQEESQAQLEREKGNAQREAQASREAQQQLALVQSELRRLEGELDTARRERDSLQLEMSLVQARYESQRIQLESELAVQLEQRVTERLAQAQESNLRQTASLREHHRKQLQDLNEQHQQELAAQLAQFKVEMVEREERQQQVAQDCELRLAREQARVRDLQSGNQQLEEQRVELIERLQAMLQAHWDEANQLLSTTLPPPNLPAPTAGCSIPGPQEPEMGERRIWTMPPVAVALKPVLQQSREARDELPGVPADLCSPSPDLSLLLGPGFQSQHSFQPLEPKPDLTPSTAGTFHPDHRAERPFPDEDPGHDGDGFLKQGLPPPSQLEGFKHFLHQLLETVPQNSENTPVDLLPPKSGPLTAASWEEVPQVPRLPPPVHKTKVPLAMASSLFRAPELPSAHPHGGGPSGGSPERGGDGLPSPRQLMDLSQLFQLCQARGWGALPAEDLLLCLKRPEHSGADGQGDNVPRRITDSRLGEIPRKEIPSQAVPRRLATAPKTEKPQGKKKSGHPVPSSLRSRGGIWR